MAERLQRIAGTIVLTALLACAASGAEKPATPAGDIPVSPIAKADGPVLIDGALDEPFWKTAETIRADYINSKKGVLSSEPRLSVKYAWDEHYLYIGYETFDKNLVAKSSGIMEGPEKNKREGCEIWSSDPKEKIDVVEFFISFGDERFFWEIHHNAANQFNDVWCTVPDPSWPIAKSNLAKYGIIFNFNEYVHDDGEYTVAMAVKMKPKADGSPSTVNNPDDVDTGYTAELRLPWGGLGAPESARPDAKKKDGAWKIEGQKLLVLAVVQDGDLTERYHHSSPTRNGDWFHKTAALWPRYVLAKPAVQPEKKPARLEIEDLSPKELAAEIFRRLDNHENAAELLQPAVDRGMAAALECAAGLSDDKPNRQQLLYDIIAVTSRCRRNHRELLRLYDPAAFELFHTEAGAEAQKAFLYPLRSEKWTSFVPEVLVNAAPRPLLEWMRAQAASENSDMSKLTPIWHEWGMDFLYRREHQFTDEVRAVVAAFSHNKKIIGEPATYAAWIRFAGDTGAESSSETVLRGLEHSDAAVRAEACLALQRFGGIKAPPSLLALAEKESDAAVLLRLGEALGTWPDDAGAGLAALSVFKRCDNAEVRRAILFSSIKAHWPQRAALILKSFDVPENGVLGTALQAVAVQPEPDVCAPTLELMSFHKTAPAALIDALGGVRDSKAVPYLLDTLKQTNNISVRLKIVLALEKIGGASAQAALLEQLKDTSNALFAQQLAGIAGRMKLPGAEETLISLAEDLTAPLPVRVQCLWSLGAFHTGAVRASLKRMDARAEYFFGAANSANPDVSVFEKVEQAHMLIKMALLQQGESSAADEAAILYARGTPTAKLSMLMLLAYLKMDHPVIGEGLKSPDFAVVLAAVHAAGAAAPQKYHDRLVALQHAPYISALMETGLDINDFDSVLVHAVAAGN